MNYNTKEKAAERVAIAKDAMKWIEAGALIPHDGLYIKPETIGFGDRFVGFDPLKPKQLRDVVLGKCEVCAKGALFLAKAVRYNNVVVPKSLDDLTDLIMDNTGPLSEHFSPSQLRLIEGEFEGFDPYNYYYTEFRSEKERMVAILQNIIDNGGTFISLTNNDEECDDC